MLPKPQLTKVFKMIKYRFYGTDSAGRPIRISKAPKMDIKDIFEKLSLQEWLDIQIMTLERTQNIILPACSRKHGHVVDQFVSIIDMSNFELGSVLDSKFVEANKKSVKAFEQNYPLIIHKTYFINVPTVFYIVWKVFSVFLSDKTKSRIEIYSKDDFSKLKDDFDLDHLPTEIGGNCGIPINDYTNFWDDEMKESYARKSLFPKK